VGDIVPKQTTDDFNVLMKQGYEILSTLPRIEEVFSVYGTADWVRQLHRRGEYFGKGSLSGGVIHELCVIAEELGVTGLAHRVLTHSPSFSAASKQQILPSTVHVQKTISMQIGDEYTLCTGVGDWSVDRNLKKFIVKHMALSSSAMHSIIINPPTIDPIKHLGVWPGMVSPFLDTTLPANLRTLIILQPSTEVLEQDFGVSISLYESLILPVRYFTAIVSNFVGTMQPTLQAVIYTVE